jgi:hypothetical protein
VRQSVERGRGEQGLAKEVRPFRPVAVTRHSVESAVNLLRVDGAV